MAAKKAPKSKLLRAIRAEVRHDKKNSARFGNSCGENDCSENNCSVYCTVPSNRAISR